MHGICMPRVSTNWDFPFDLTKGAPLCPEAAVETLRYDTIPIIPELHLNPNNLIKLDKLT